MKKIIFLCHIKYETIWESKQDVDDNVTSYKRWDLTSMNNISLKEKRKLENSQAA